MLSNMVRRGFFHCRIMTSGGRAATSARTVQPDSEFKWPAMPAVQTAETQTVATVALMDSGSILQVYGPAVNGAVPECTGTPQSNRSVPSGAQPKAERPSASHALCDREQRGVRPIDTVAARVRGGARSRTICC
jgi:hypothetical protein